MDRPFPRWVVKLKALWRRPSWQIINRIRAVFAPGALLDSVQDAAEAVTEFDQRLMILDQKNGRFSALEEPVKELTKEREQADTRR